MYLFYFLFHQTELKKIDNVIFLFTKFLTSEKIYYFVVGAVINDNVGWKEYMKENIDEFHDIPLEWESGSKVKQGQKLSINQGYNKIKLQASLCDKFESLIC